MIVSQCPKCQKQYELADENIGKKVKCSRCDTVFEVQNETSVMSNNGHSNSKVDSEEKQLKPHKFNYIFVRSAALLFIVLISLSLIVILIVQQFIVTQIVAAIIAGIAVIMGLAIFLTNIAYKKENYDFKKTKINYNSGTLFSDNSVEVPINKITAVRVKLPFLQYMIFKTGFIYINTAGSAKSGVILKHVAEPMEVYEYIQTLMRNNGYHLQKDKLVQEESPHWLGIFGEIFSGMGSFVLFLAYLGIGTLAAISEMLESVDSASSDGLSGSFVDFLSMLSPFLIIVILIAVITVKYLDLKRRKYQVFTDSIFYNEGFLTKNYAFLPMERVADSENTQSFLSKLFGLHDIIVSSEGSSNKVKFKNMIHGEQMIKNIKFLKNDIKNSPAKILHSDDTSNNFVGYVDKTEKPFHYNEQFEGRYKMNALKTFLGSIIYIILGLIAAIFLGEDYGFFIAFIAITTGINSALQYFFTTYSIENSSIDYRYKFMTLKHKSFSVDKITSVQIRESILDRLLGTCSIVYRSIGSTGVIVYKNIKKTQELQKNILEKVGIYESEETKNLPIHFTLKNFFFSNPLHLVFIAIFFITYVFYLLLASFIEDIHFVDLGTFFIAVTTFLVISGLIGVLFNKLYYSRKFYIQKMSETYISSIKGILWKVSSYVRLDNIKSFSSKKYPLTNTGSLFLDIAGDQVISTDKKNKQSVIGSFKLAIHFVENVHSVHDGLDNTITDNELDTTEVIESKQDVGNSIIALIIFGGLVSVIMSFESLSASIASILIFALLVSYVVFYIKMKAYSIQKGRIILLYGIVYKSKKSIVFEKFNYLEKSQKILGKIFNNGSLYVYTLGSGQVDMKMSDVDKYKEIYELLKK